MYVGCQIRILLAEPNAEFVKKRNEEEKGEGSIESRVRTSLTRLNPVLDVNNIEIRLHDTPLYCSIYRFDSEMFVTPHLYGIRGAAAPLLCFKEIDRGIFSKYEMHFQEIWKIAKRIKPAN